MVERSVPTEPGWYFAKFQAEGFSSEMQCARVFMHPHSKSYVAKLYGSFSIVYVESLHWKWFGKVPMPVEV